MVQSLVQRLQPAVAQEERELNKRGTQSPREVIWGKAKGRDCQGGSGHCSFLPGRTEPELTDQSPGFFTPAHEAASPLH